MKKLIIPFVLAFVTLFESCYLGQCPNKDSFIKSFDQFASKVSKLEESKDLETYDKDFYAFMNDCYPLYMKELSTEDKKSIWVNALKYYMIKHEGRIDLALDEAKSKLDPKTKADFDAFIAEYPASFFKNFEQTLSSGLKSLSEAMENFGKEIQPNIKKLGDQLEESSEKIADELKKAAEEIESNTK
jgi:gas vesicle protein